MTVQTTIELRHGCFTEKEQLLVEHHGLKASTFLFSTGVEGLRITNGVGEMAMLPFQGQQIWDLRFRDRPLTMQSMFTDPYPTTEYLHTYGGFFVHCGAVAMGVPAAEDKHPTHGELPNARYQNAQLLIGADERGRYFGVTGTFQYTVAFNHNYVAHPLVKMYENSTEVSVAIEIHNLKRTPMELMYLAHANFRPVDHGELLYCAIPNNQHVRVRTSIPSHISPKPGYREYIAMLAQSPEQHHILKPGLMFDPEVVFFVNCLPDAQGWSHSLQIHPDGTGDFIRHRPAELDHGVRWISRTPDQDCLGIMLPATAEPEGYLAEKAKGNIKIIEAGGTYRTEMWVGSLTVEEARQAAAHVREVVRQHAP
jgi:hypothetical protein